MNIHAAVMRLLFEDILRGSLGQSCLKNLLVWFMMGEKLESVSITAYRGREFYGGCSKLTISTLSELSVWGKKSWKEKKKERKED